MTSKDQQARGGKSSQRKQKRNKNAEPRQIAVPAAAEAATDPVIMSAAPASYLADVRSSPPSANGPVATAVLPLESSADRVSDEPVASPLPPPPAANPVVGMQALANAYRDCTRKSLEEAQSFAEKLSAARTLDKAVEAQTEFARKTCENFVADARKIRELHRELFWQAFKLPDWPRRTTR